MLAVGTLGTKIVAVGLIFASTFFGGHTVLSHHLAMSQGVVKSTSNMTVSYQPSPGSQVSFKIFCSAHASSGTHPNAKAICATIVRLGTSLFAPVPSGTACSQIYGGPETATVIGTLNGLKINSTFSRTDGCQVARWETAKAFFTFPGYSIVRGRIELSPTCPGPVRPGQNCTNSSAAGTVIVSNKVRGSFKAVALADIGFAVLLRSGTWTFTGSSISAIRCSTRIVTVPMSADVVLACDTGMR